MCLRAAERAKKRKTFWGKIAKEVLVSPVLADTRTAWQNCWSQLLESIILSSFHFHFLPITSAQTTLWLGAGAENRPPIRASCLDYCIFLTHQLFSHRCFHLQWLDFGRTWEVLWNFLCTATCSEDVFLVLLQRMLLFHARRCAFTVVLFFVVGRWGLV